MSHKLSYRSLTLFVAAALATILAALYLALSPAPAAAHEPPAAQETPAAPE